MINFTTHITVLLLVLSVNKAMKSNLVFYTSSGGFSPDLMVCTVDMLDRQARDAEFEPTTGQCDIDPPSSSNVSSYIFLQNFEPHFVPGMNITVDVLTSINVNYPVVFEVRVPNPGAGDMMLIEFYQTSGLWLKVQMVFDGLYINATLDAGFGTSIYTTTNNTLAGSDVVVQISFIFYSGVVQVYLDTTRIVETLAIYQQQLKAHFYSNFATCNRIVYIWRVQRLNFI